MSYPTPSEYQEAVQFPEDAFSDPELKTATPRENVLGLPQPITGAFAAVFPMTTKTGVRYAAKCFLSDVPEQQRRYEAVADHLAKVDLPWTVEFDYQPSGIQVDGDTYPVLKMEWARGTGLNRFVAEHLDDPGVFSILAEQWAAMCADLEAAQMAHGDLQHGNVLVQAGDADRSKGGGEEADVTLRLVDYDTAYVPALSGQTSAEVGHRNYQHPDRTDQDFGVHLDRFSSLAVYTALRACARRPDLWERFDTGENLLFRDGDFYDPSSSPLFEELQHVDALSDLVEALRRACYVEPEAVPPLQEVVSGRADVESAPVAARASRRERRGRRAERSLFEQAYLPVVLVGIAGAVLAGWTLGTAASAVAAGVGLTAAVWSAAAQYRRHPIVRRRLRLRQESERFTRLIHNLRRQVDALGARRSAVLESVDERRAERLQELQEEVIYDHLKHHFIGEAREVEGITHKHVVRLKSANIRTAYEAMPERVGEIRRLSDPTRARLAMWRASLVREAEDDLPESLSPAEERRLRRYVQHRVDDIDAEMSRAREKIEVQRTERDRVEERRDEMPVLTFVQYLAFLLHVGTLPDRERPPAPSPPQPSHAADRPDPLPQPADTDAPWWQQMRDA